VYNWYEWDNPHKHACNLQKIYDSEINVTIRWLWDCGTEVRLGDQVNGFLAEERFTNAAGILPWLQQAIAHFYPNSTYARSLLEEVRARATQRLFHPPRTGMSVHCHCGAPHAAPPGMKELIAFICTHCGESATVEPPQIQ
jgi:hypothetical protein